MPYQMSRSPHHPRLQRQTWRTVRVLTGEFMSESNETSNMCSKYNCNLINIYSNSLRNQPVLQDSRMTLRGQVESWQGNSCRNQLKLQTCVLNNFQLNAAIVNKSEQIPKSSLTKFHTLIWKCTSIPRYVNFSDSILRWVSRFKNTQLMNQLWPKIRH